VQLLRPAITASVGRDTAAAHAEILYSTIVHYFDAVMRTQVRQDQVTLDCCPCAHCNTTTAAAAAHLKVGQLHYRGEADHIQPAQVQRPQPCHLLHLQWSTTTCPGIATHEVCRCVHNPLSIKAGMDAP
jgi:hypothetical protein